MKYTVIYSQYAGLEEGMTFGLRMESELYFDDDKHSLHELEPLKRESWCIVVRPEKRNYEYRAFHNGDWQFCDFEPQAMKFALDIV